MSYKGHLVQSLARLSGLAAVLVSAICIVSHRMHTSLVIGIIISCFLVSGLAYAFLAYKKHKGIY